MVAFDVDNMIQACKDANTYHERDLLWEAFRTLRFYDLIDGKTFDKFCEEWCKEFYGKKW